MVKISDYTWSEDPLKRPTTERIQSMLRSGHRFKKSVLDTMLEAMDDYTASLEQQLEDSSNKLEVSNYRLSHLLDRTIPQEIMEEEVDDYSIEKRMTVSVVFVKFNDLPSAKNKQLLQYMAAAENHIYSSAESYNAFVMDMLNGVYAIFVGLNMTSYHMADAAMLACDVTWNIPQDLFHNLSGHILCAVHTGDIEVACSTGNQPKCHIKGELIHTGYSMLSESLPNKILISQTFKDAILPLQNKVYDIIQKNPVQQVIA